MKNKHYFLALIFTLIPNEIYSQTCTFDGVTNPNVPTLVKMDDVAYNAGYNKEYILITGDPTAITGQNGKANDLFQAELVDKTLIITSNKSIADVDNELKRQTGTYDENLELIVEGCSNTVGFEYMITDTNNHPPTFLTPQITYKLPSPLAPRTPLSIFGSQIIATDLDYTNSDIKFTIEPPSTMFDVSTREISSDSKDFEAVIKPIEYTWLHKTETIKLRATDALGLASEELLEIVLEIDDDAALPEIPEFSQPFYSFKYNGDEASDPKLTGDTITVTTKSKADLTPLIEPNPEIFQLDYDSTSGEISINLKNPIPNPDKKDIVIFTLTAKKSEKELASTAILVTVPKVLSIPTFAEAYYTATYKVREAPEERDTVSLDKDISVVEYSDNVVVEVLDNTGFKSVQSPDGTNSWSIQVNTNLDQAELDKGKDIVLKLSTSISGSPDKSYTSVRIQLPPVTVLEFTSDTYYAVYKVINDGPPTVEFDGAKIDVKDVSGATVDFVESNTNFHISPTYDIVIDKPLDNSVLIAGDNIILPIKVSLRSLKSALSTLVIKIDADSKITPPKFTEILYNAKYTVNPGTNDDKVGDITPNILTSSENVAGISVAVVGTYKDNFSAHKDAASYIINVDKDLTEKELNNPEIIIDLEASIPDVTEKGSAKIVLKLPEKTSQIVPAFSATAYKATYKQSEDGSSDDILTIDAMKPVKIVSEKAEDTVVTVTSEYSSFFKPSITPDGWTFTVIKKLDATVIETTHQIIVNLEAALPDSSNVGHAVVVVDLPLDITTIRATPIFTQPLYKSHIDKDNQLIMEDKNIATSGEYVDVTVVSVESKYQPYFTPNFNSESNYWTITLDQSLPDDTENQIVVQLNAHLEGSPKDGAASLLVKVKDDLKVGKFDKLIYTCSYTPDKSGIDKVSCDSDIIVSGSFSKITISDEDDYKDNFKLESKKPQGTYNFVVVNDLSDDVLESQTEVLVVIELVEGEDKSTATVLVNLPLKEDSIPIKFKNNAYTASYSKSGSVHLIDGPITLNVEVSDNPQVSIKSDDEYHKNFKIVETDEGSTPSWNFVVDTPLDQNVLDDKVSITVTVIATVLNRSPASAAVVVNLPKKTSEYSFNFNENFYTADYENDAVTFNQKILLDGETEGIEISLEGDFAGYFAQEQDGNEIKVTLNQPLPKEALERPSITNSIRAAKGDTDEVIVVAFIINNKAAMNGGGGDTSSKGPNDTTFIIVIAMLAVLLVVGMVGSAIFYYKRRNKMAVVEEPETTPRFTKNSNMSDSKKTSESVTQRRPTGLHILNQEAIESDDLSNNNEKETFEGSDRRKSVIFDEVVEEMEIDPNDEDQKEEEEDTNTKDIDDDDENSTKL